MAIDQGEAGISANPHTSASPSAESRAALSQIDSATKVAIASQIPSSSAAPSHKRYPKRHRQRAPERYTPAHNHPLRSEEDMSHADWIEVYTFMRSRRQLSIVETSDRLRVRLETELLELRAYFDERRIDPALVNRWQEPPAREPGKPLVFSAALDAATDVLTVTEPEPRKRKRSKPASKPPPEHMTELERLLAESISQTRARH